MRDGVKGLFIVILCVLLSACGGSVVKAPVGTRGDPERSTPAYHVVKRGESLYSIAWQYGYDYQALARRNDIRPPYTIYAGQKLRLQASRPRPPRSESKSRQTNESISKKPYTDKVEVDTPPASARRDRVGSSRAELGPVKDWQWPVKGRILRRFDRASPGKKGIGISGERGARIRAAAGGRVVYSGSGLVGYGRLIIIKHNDNYLSAYGHNDRLLVREGQSVAAGEAIARMGSSGTNRTMLHFEIRRNGDPVDPMRFLP